MGVKYEILLDYQVEPDNDNEIKQLQALLEAVFPG